MKYVSIFLIFYLPTLISPTPSPSPSPTPSHLSLFPSDQQLTPSQVTNEITLQNIEMQVKTNQQNKIWNQMNDWIKSQTLENYQNAVPDSLNGENFLFQILEGRQRDFVLPHNGVYPINILLKIFEFTDGELTVPNNPLKDSNINLIVLDQRGKQYFQTLVYLKKNVKIEGREEMYRIRIQNNYHKDLIVRISLEKKPNIIKPFNDTKIDPFTTKIKHVLEEVEAGIDEKRMLFKSQMGFMEQEKEQHSNMLILTGLELMTLVAAALVQLFCLKNLIDNKTFV